MTTARKRLFFAAALDHAAAREARGVAESLAADDGGAVRWVDPENYHITLRFLGPTGAAQIPQLVAAVSRESASQSAFRATLGSLLILPGERRARAIALEVESEGELECLAARVERGVRDAGVPPCDRGFRPHLTLGRTRRGRRYRPATLLDPSLSPVSFPVDAAWLFESELSREGARYHALERISLGASSHPH